MADHMRIDGSADDKRAALAGSASARNAYRHTTAAYEHLPQAQEERARQGGADSASPVRQTPQGQRAQPGSRSRVELGPEGDLPLSKMSLGQFIRHNAVYILSVAAVAAIVVALIFGLRAFSDLLDEPLSDGEGPAAYASPYDWSKLEWADGRAAYVDGGQVKSRTGVDVSGYQGQVDWDAVAADGIDFAMIRLGYRGATEGALHLDDFYGANLAGAKAAGLECGVYFFSQAQTVDEAVEEAEFVLDNLGGAALEYPVVFDAEERVGGVDQSRAAGLGRDAMSAIMEAFCARVEAAGYRSMVYGNRSDLARFEAASLEGRDVWWAQYGVEAPQESLDIAMWQYASDGSVAGIAGSADMSIDLSGALS